MSVEVRIPKELSIYVYRDGTEGYSFNIFGDGINLSLECDTLNLEIEERKVNLDDYPTA